MTIKRKMFFTLSGYRWNLFSLLGYHHVRVQHPFEHYIAYDADVDIVSEVLRIKVKRHLRSLKMPIVEDSKSL